MNYYLGFRDSVELRMTPMFMQLVGIPKAG